MDLRAGVDVTSVLVSVFKMSRIRRTHSCALTAETVVRLHSTVSVWVVVPFEISRVCNFASDVISKSSGGRVRRAREIHSGLVAAPRAALLSTLTQRRIAVHPEGPRVAFCCARGCNINGRTCEYTA